MLSYAVVVDNSGNNFGPIGARVLIGTNECQELIWISHSELRCATPPGTGTDRPIIIIQCNVTDPPQPWTIFGHDHNGRIDYVFV